MSLKNYVRGLRKGWLPNGLFVTDPTPVSIPMGFEIPETLEQKIARVVRSESMIHLAQNAGVDTFDEFDDFEDTDTVHRWSKYEIDEISSSPIKEVPPGAPKSAPEAERPPSSNNPTKEAVKPPKPESDDKKRVKKRVITEEYEED